MSAPLPFGIDFKEAWTWRAPSGEEFVDYYFQVGRPLVCTLCGRPWIPGTKNVCECGGFSTWGPEWQGDMNSWVRVVDRQGKFKGWVPRDVEGVMPWPEMVVDE